MSKDIPDFMRGFDLDDDWGMTPVGEMPKAEPSIDRKAIDNQNLELSKVKSDVSSIKSMMNEIMQIVSEKETITKEISDEETLLDIWKKMYPMSRECYRVSRSPGDKIESLNEVTFDKDDETNLIGFDNFAAIQCDIKTIEVLYLSHINHIRAKYNNINGILKGEWIIP